MELEKKKFILDIVLAIFVVIALFISIKSCKIAKDANKISNDALKTAQYQFLQINRPYIIIAPEKFEGGLFWKVKQQDNAILIELQYKIKNLGNVCAKDINMPNKIAVGPKMKFKKDADVTFIKPDKISLGPGDEFKITPNLLMGFKDKEEAKKNLSHITSEKSEGVTFLLSVNYSNELDESLKYRTYMENRIHNDTAAIIKSEMILLTEDK